MKRSTKIWLWSALALSVGTTGLNLYAGRWPSVCLAILSMIALCILLFCEKRLGFQLMCVCYLISCAVGIWDGISSGTAPAVAIAMSVIGASLIPGLTALFLKGQWASLQ